MAYFKDNIPPKLTASQLQDAKVYLKGHPNIMPLPETLYLNNEADKEGSKLAYILQNANYFWNISHPTTVLLGTIGHRPLSSIDGDIIAIDIPQTIAELERLGWTFNISSPDIKSDNCYSFVCYNNKHDILLVSDMQDISMKSMYDVLSGIISCLLIENTEWFNVLTDE